jgi:HK97 family phage major capsid protein
MDAKLKGLVETYNAACDTVEAAIGEREALAADASEENVQLARETYESAKTDAASAKAAKEEYESIVSARATFTKVEVPADEKTELSVKVNEPDLYRLGGQHRFLDDLFASHIKRDPLAAARLGAHQAVEVEKYAVGTATLGGIIPPQYLVGMYAKASRNGRVYADSVNRDDPLPDEGMSLIVPRLTTATAAGVQASESATLTTQDPAETDLTVPVRTLGGYIPVSRQTLERASYSEAILFEDLVARYFAALDVDAINGSGSSGHMLGVLQTSGISASTSSTATVAGVWPKIADVIQQINTAVGGLGFYADKIVMHPRRWGFFEAALDSSNRPVFGITGTDNYAPAAEGEASGYGAVGRMHGLPVFIDANIPTNLGSGTNEDRIIVEASRVVHLWERKNDPVSLAFEQQAGTSLQVQLVAYGYAAFTAGRYPAASGVVSGAGLVAPTF